MQKILKNGNTLEIATVQAHGSPQYGSRHIVVVVEMDPYTSFYRRNGKNVKNIHYQGNTVIWYKTGTSPDYRATIKQAEDVFNAIN